MVKAPVTLAIPLHGGDEALHFAIELGRLVEIGDVRGSGQHFEPRSGDQRGELLRTSRCVAAGRDDPCGRGQLGLGELGQVAGELSQVLDAQVVVTGTRPPTFTDGL